MRFFNFSLMGSLIFSSWAFSLPKELSVPLFKEVPLAVEHVFVPLGFDSNDTDIQAVVSGWLPNPCHEWSRAIVEQETDGSLVISLKAFMKKSSDTICINMAVPYLRSIKLGPLPEGITHFRVDQIKTKIQIDKAASQGVDDYIYAEIGHVSGAQKVLNLEIKRASPCIEIDQVEFVSNELDTCAVLPIMKQVMSHCPKTPDTLQWNVIIPENCLMADKVLFHVRSLGGESVNFLYDNRQL